MREGWYVNSSLNLYECYSTEGKRIATMEARYWARASSMWKLKLEGEI